jgi:hypothetical protein
MERVMTKAVWTAAVTATVFLVSTPVFAQQTANATVTVSATVAARAKLQLGTASISFPDTDPDTLAVLTAAPFSISVKVRTTAGSPVNLDVSAPDFTEGGGGVIPISNLQWAATGSGFPTPGTMNNAAISAGAWVGSGNQNGTHTYSLQNSWDYNVGSYGTTVTYTLTAP